jgi:hypothetical protein
MVSHINGNVKGREAFRPFAPSVLAEEASSWFEGIAPYTPGSPGRWGLQGERRIVCAPPLAARNAGARGVVTYNSCLVQLTTTVVTYNSCLVQLTTTVVTYNSCLVQLTTTVATYNSCLVQLTTTVVTYNSCLVQLTTTVATYNSCLVQLTTTVATYNSSRPNPRGQPQPPRFCVQGLDGNPWILMPLMG